MKRGLRHGEVVDIPHYPVSVAENDGYWAPFDKVLKKNNPYLGVQPQESQWFAGYDRSVEAYNKRVSN